MVSVEEASRIIFSHRYRPEPVLKALQQSVGQVLAEPIFADRDFPPFDRVTIDGIGVSYRQLIAGKREFDVEGIQAAGERQKKLNDLSKCIEVMTGAIVPEGVDVIIRYEDVNIRHGSASVIGNSFHQFQNIHKQGLDVLKGSKIINPGKILSPAEIALLASVGKKEISIRKFPDVAIISTGNELVDIGETPHVHQIRRSNSYALQASLSQLGVASKLYHLPDDEQKIEKGLHEIMQSNDVLILSGGVSKGKFDFIPTALENLGIKKLFHKVNQRPGKPFWFGASNGTTVFALPGNPVSTYMCFYKYIYPWLFKSMGAEPTSLTAILSDDFSFEPELTFFLQVAITVEEGKLKAHPRQGKGSGDFANLGNVDGFLQLPPENDIFRAGEVFPYIPFRLLQ